MAETVLLELAADHVDSFMIIKTAEQRLAHRLLAQVDDAAAALVLAKVLRQVVSVSGVLGRRTEELLGTVETLRLQRRLHAAGERR